MSELRHRGGAAGRTTWMPVIGLADETSRCGWLCSIPVVRSSRHQPFITERPGGDGLLQGGGRRSFPGVSLLSASCRRDCIRTLCELRYRWIGSLEVASPSKKSETPICQMGTDPFPISGRGVWGPLIRLWEPEIPRLFVGATPLRLLAYPPSDV